MRSNVPDLTLDPQSFQSIADFAYQQSGLKLVAEKAPMVEARLRHRLRQLGMSGFADYCNLIDSESGEKEREHLISALTTNVSYFFRENHHFETFRAEVIKRINGLEQGERLRIWSAGCSRGQEAISAALVLLDVLPNPEDIDVRILATDIDREVLKFGRFGQFSESMTDGIPKHLLGKYFEVRRSPQGEKIFEVNDKVKKLIKFNYLNLLDDWPMMGRFDFVFCRNVVIYFDVPTQSRIWPRIHKMLTPQGLLFLGHSERIADPQRFGFAVDGTTTYRPL